MKRVGKSQESLIAIRWLAANHLEVDPRVVRLVRSWGCEDDDEYGLKIVVNGLIADRYEIRFEDGKYTLLDTF